ncbi:hypothetical protein GDO78_012956 [Eleutherodactylus coqui]|uniref:Nucleoporin NUP188 n=2 Tax=Eleutherodactylus coqui TaxID=57060 RepID=A0A8J6EZV6_ELECQ|nr:hypothetical protein GDO78_012956 [Eleutherodactylus coqui]
MAAAGGLDERSSRELWIILLGRSAMRDPVQIKAELDRYGERFLQGLSFYKPPSTSSADKVKANKNLAPALKELGQRISKFLGLDERQSVQLLQCYLQDDYRGTQDSIKLVPQDERQSQALILKIADYYYEERICMLRSVLLLLTYFQDEKHPYKKEFNDCMDMLQREDLMGKYRKHFEDLCKEEAPTWETHGNLMTERQVSRWFAQCLREQAMLLEIIFLYYAYFAISPSNLLALTRLFKEQGFGRRQQNRHLVEQSLDPLIDRIGYFEVLILLEGIDMDSLQDYVFKDELEHPFTNEPQFCKDMDNILLTFGDIPHHAPVLLAWALLRHTLSPDEVATTVRKMGSMAVQLHVFKYLTSMLRGLGSGENNCTTSTACLCVYSLLCFALTSMEEHTLGKQQVWTDLHHTGFLPFAASSSSGHFISTENMNAGGYGTLLGIEQSHGEYSVTISFLRLVTTLVKGQLGSMQSQGLVPCILFVLREMLPNYHRWRYNSHGVRENLGYLILNLIHAILNLCPDVAPMSVYACLGSDAAAIRDAFLNRLQCSIEDMQIKVMILEFLTVAVETQPGLIELFLNLEVKETNGTKEFSMGQWSCLQVVLDLIDLQQSDQFWCTPQLHRYAIAFLHALWQDRRDSAMTVLRTKPNFWENLTAPLFGTLVPPSESSDLSVLETCAFIMRIICLEIYYAIQYVHLADVMHLTDVKVKQELFQDILSGTEILFQVPSSAPCLQLGFMLCTLMMILLRRWKNELRSPEDIIKSLARILEGVLQADKQQMDKVKARIFSVLICTLEMKQMKASNIPQYQQLVLSVCENLQDEVMSLIDETRHGLTTGDGAEDKDSMETDDMPRTRHKDQRDTVCVLALHLAKELCQADEDGDQWLQVIRQLPVLPMLFSALEISLRGKQNLHFCEASFHLLFTLAKTHQGAAAIAGAGITQSICLPLLSVYQLSSNGASTAQPPLSSRKAVDAPSWPGVYRLTVSLMERLLKTLRYNFLTDALDFVGVHQERILQCLGAVRTVQSISCLEEADNTVCFLLQLSNFTKEWHFHLPQLMKDIQVSLCYLCQSCTSLLYSRKMLQHYLQIKSSEAVTSGSTSRGQRTPQTPSKQSKPESEALELRALRSVQHSLLKILSKTLAALRAFTPDLCQILQPLDLAQYQLLLALNFSTPAFDADVVPSFGTFLATVNVMLNMLGEMDKKKDPPFPSAAPASPSEESKNLKPLLLFIIENCFYLSISQAVRYLRDPSVHPRDKQRMKQELGSELSTLLSSLNRYTRRGVPSSPAAGVLPSPQPKSGLSTKAAPEAQEPIIQLVQAFIRHVQR